MGMAKKQLKIMKEAFRKELLKLAIIMLKAGKQPLTAENVIMIYRKLVIGINTPTRL